MGPPPVCQDEGATTGLKHIVLAYARNSGSLQQIFIYASVCI